VIKKIDKGFMKKKDLSLLYRRNNNVNLKIYYKWYCKVLLKVILAAKILHYNTFMLNSNNKMKSTLKLINAEKEKSKHSMDIQSLMIDNNVIINQNLIVKTFNNYFMPIVDSINTNNNKHLYMANPINYLSNNLIKSLRSKNMCVYDGI
jgi:hypothetical protein